MRTHSRCTTDAQGPAGLADGASLICGNAQSPAGHWALLRLLIARAHGCSRERLTCSNGNPVALVAAGLPHFLPQPRAPVAPAAGRRTVPGMHPRTTPLPPPDLADPIWTVEHLALAFRLGARATRALVAAPGFPAAFRAGPARTARLYWRREQILDLVAAGTAAIAGPAPAPAPATAPAAPAPARPTTAAAPPRYVAGEDDALAAIAAVRTARAVAA